MIIGKRRKIGRIIDEIKVGEKLELTEKIEDRDILLYLGLTDDANPLYIQHDYASQTNFKAPVVPSIMLIGKIHSAISKYFPGPGSYILNQEITFHHPVYHYTTVYFLLEIIDINIETETIKVSVHGKNEEGEQVLSGHLLVKPPQKKKTTEHLSLDSFY